MKAGVRISEVSIHKVPAEGANPTKKPGKMTSPGSPRRSSEQSVAESLAAYVDDSDCIVHRTIRRYTQFMRQCYDGTVNEIYKRISVDNNMYLYEERIGTFESSSFVQEIYPGARKYTSATERQRRRSGAYGRMTQMHAFGGGEITGTLEDVMAGVYAESSRDHTVNCAVQFGIDNVLDCGIMETFERADEQHPFRYLGVKWLEIESVCEGAETENANIIDELYWIERTGIYTSKSGRKFGFQLVKTVDSDFYSSDDRLYRSIQRSVCYLYHQVSDEVVHVFVRGIVEVPHLSNADVGRVVDQAASIMIAPTRARQCERMRTIAEMIERSKTNRAELLVCRCSKVVPDLPRVDLCADCRAAMMQCKLLSTRDAAARKQQLVEKARYSIASTTSTASSSDSNPASSSVHLQTRRGSLRQDGKTPDDTDPEVLSLRMLIPIREERPSSAYRVKKKGKGNVLTKMLTEHENRRRLIASAYIPPTDD